MDVTHQVFQPNHVIGFEVVALGRADGLAKGDDLGHGVRDGSRGHFGMIRGKACVYEVPVAVTCRVGEADVPLCVGYVSDGRVFSSISSLPSSLSADDAPSLFE